MHLSDLAILLAQIATILTLSRLMGLVFSRIGLPQVVGEMAAGIMLGPTLLGVTLPGVYAALFPAQSIDYLALLSQLGIVFFLFLIGLELDVKLLASQGRTAMRIGVSSIVVPFALGMMLAWHMNRQTSFVNAASLHDMQATALFMGTAIAVTAFPVLARILNEKHLQQTRVGAICIGAAAANDVVAWCVLAAVVAFAQAGGAAQGILTAGLAVVFTLLMVYAVRPFLRRLQAIHDRQTNLPPSAIAIIFLLILLSAITTELIGIHAMFGAFVLGAVMPKGSRFVAAIGHKIEDFTVVLLLPIFFAYAGINTNIVFSNGDKSFWVYAGVIFALACGGKIIGAGMAARSSGLTLRESLGVGVLMNTRGLMELVILNVGRDLKIIGDEIYAMMVLMALGTTAITVPLLRLVYRPGEMRGRKAGDQAYTILIPVSMPRSAIPLTRLADLLTRQQPRQVIGLYIRNPRSFELADHPEGENGDAQPMAHLREAAAECELPLETLFRTNDDPADEIAQTANSQDADLVLMGFHKPLITGSILGGTVHRVMANTRADVGVFVDRGFHKANSILVPYLNSSHDRLALELAARIGQNAKAQVTLLHVVEPGRDKHKAGGAEGIDRMIPDPSQPHPVHMKVIESDSPVDAVIQEAKGHDLVIIGVSEEWGLESGMFGFRRERLANQCSAPMLIVRRGSRPERLTSAK